MGNKKNGFSLFLKLFKFMIAFCLEKYITNRQCLIYNQDLNAKASRTNIPLE